MKTISKFSLYIIIALFISVLSSCEKDRVTLLTDGIWTFENITTSSDDDVIKTLVAGLKAYHTDGTLQFFSDGAYVMQFPLGDDETGTWELVGETQLVFSPDAGGVQTSSIDNISKSELVYIATFVDQNSDSFNTTLTWVK